MKPICIYGGSFDPVHLGHIKTACAIQQQFPQAEIVFVPCKIPVLKNATQASTTQRVTMLQLALTAYPQFKLDLKEIERPTPSYMIDTLHSFRQQYGQHVPLILLLGFDAFLQLPQWHQWQRLLTQCHLLIMHRMGIDETIENVLLIDLLQQNETPSADELLTKPAGKIYRLNAGEYAVSSSWLRREIRLGHQVRSFLPSNVDDYIKQEKLYVAHLL